MDLTPEETFEFVEALDLPAEPAFDPFEMDDGAEPPKFTDKEQSVAIGSQIASFSAGFDADLRSAISNIFLIAQLAADKALETTGGDTETWYAKYVETIGKLGVLDEDRGYVRKEITGTTLEVHDVALSLMKELLGSAVASAQLLIKILDGINGMAKDRPWITLFQHKSYRASANQFQIAHVEAGADFPVLYLVAFELAAEARVTQVLVFKLSDSQARLRQFSKKSSLDPDRLRQAAPKIANKLGAHIAANIEEIEI